MVHSQSFNINRTCRDWPSRVRAGPFEAQPGEAHRKLDGSQSAKAVLSITGARDWSSAEWMEAFTKVRVGIAWAKRHGLGHVIRVSCSEDLSDCSYFTDIRLGGLELQCWWI